MKKLKFYLSQNLYAESNNSIRQKSDIIALLLKSVSEIIIDDSVDKELGYYEVIVDKMSRIIFTLKKDNITYKKFSFTFPFYLKESQEAGISKWDIYDSSGSLLNSQIISILIILFNEGLFNENINSDIEPIEFYDRILEAIKEVNAERDITETLIWHFVRKLFLFEPGYIRYDFDESDRCNEFMHPLHHLDFYYSNSATMKIGVAKNNKDFIRWKEDSFENLVDVKTPCYYLKI